MIVSGLLGTAARSRVRCPLSHGCTGADARFDKSSLAPLGVVTILS